MSSNNTEAPAPVCENCRWWDNSTKHRDDDQDITGLCRVRAPRFDKRTALAVWPFTEDADSCGKFEISDEAAKKVPMPF